MAEPTTHEALFIDELRGEARRYRELADEALAQVDDASFVFALDAESNSLALIVKHVANNLRSRWTDFYATDGEKPDRDRDSEFIGPGETSRANVMATWNAGWSTLFDTLSSLQPADLTAMVSIRSEHMPAIAAMHRAVSHIGQHVGQIVLLAKHYRSADWKTLSIPRGRSSEWQASVPSHR